MNLEVHPVADLFPMLADDELQLLADDIAERGLVQPIVLDSAGRVLDGRNRLAACAKAGVEPTFTTYEGDDPDGYSLAVNIARRHMTASQRAITIARAVRVAGISQREGSERFKLNQGRIGQATTILDHAPDLADAVASGAKPLDEAYRIARDRKTAADSEENQLARLRAEDPELADKVVEGDLSLRGAFAELAERQKKKAEDQRDARALLARVVELLAPSARTAGFVVTWADQLGPYDLELRELMHRFGDARQVMDDLAMALMERGGR